MSITVERKAELIKSYGQGEGDTGSPVQSVVPWRWLTTATSASIRSRYSAYSGTSCRDGWRWEMNVTRSRNSGCC